MMLPRERIQSALAYLGIGGISWRRLLSLCSDRSFRTNGMRDVAAVHFAEYAMTI